MSLFELEKQCLNGELNKADFISAMYSKNHDSLFQYSEFIKNRDIQKIEITDGCVIMTSRELGIKIICNKYDERIAPIEILNFKYYEKECSDMIFQLVSDNDTVFDIGGNMGWYSIGLDKEKNNLDIHAFEPIPNTYESLLANTKINGTDINIYNMGFSDKKEELSFFFYKEGSVNASSAIMNEEREHVEIKCQVDTLDNFFAQKTLQKLDFIKCDVEGAELFVFKGGYETINKYKPIVFTEMLRKWSEKFGYHPNEIIKLFASMGYKCFFVLNGKLKELEKMTADTISTNFFFLNLEKHQDIILKLSV